VPEAVVLPALALVAGPLVARVLAAPLAPALADAAAPAGVSESPAAAAIDWTFGSAEEACIAALDVATGSAAAARMATIVVAPCVAADALSTTADASCVAAVPLGSVAAAPGEVAAAPGDVAPPFREASEPLEAAGPTGVEPDNGALATGAAEPLATRSAERGWPATDPVVLGSPAKTAGSVPLLNGGRDPPTALAAARGADWLPGDSEVAPPGAADVDAPTEPAELAGLAELVRVARLVGPAGGDRLPAGGKETPLAPPLAGVAALLGSLLRLLLPVT
jgi:hypothetical protein